MKIPAFGDSIMKGVVNENNRYSVSSQSFTRICENMLGVEISNRSRFGSTVGVGKEIIDRNREAIRASDSPYVLLEFGGNDCDFVWSEISAAPSEEHFPRTRIDRFRRIYSEIISEIRGLGKEPVLLSLPPIDPERYFNWISRDLDKENILLWLNGNKNFLFDWHERYNIEIFKLGMEFKVSVIDITSRFLEQKNYRDFLCSDGIHPNEKGHEMIAEIIREHLREKGITLG